MCVRYAHVSEGGRSQLRGGNLRTICPGNETERVRTKVHPQTTRTSRAGPDPKRDGETERCACERCRYSFTSSIVFYL